MGTHDNQDIARLPADTASLTASISTSPTATVATQTMVERPLGWTSMGLILSGAALFSYGVRQMRRIYRVKRALTGPSQQNLSSPCRSCRFYTHHLNTRCAVHPDSVLKPAAHRCQDYWRLNSSRFLR